MAQLQVRADRRQRERLLAWAESYTPRAVGRRERPRSGIAAGPERGGHPPAQAGVATVPRAPAAAIAEAEGGSARDPTNRFVRQALLQRRCDASFIENATLLTSELVTNAVLHAVPVHAEDGDITLRLRFTSTTVRLEIVDGSPLLPVLRPMGDGGRGLHIVDAVATSWGAVRQDAGKMVWFEL